MAALPELAFIDVNIKKLLSAENSGWAIGRLVRMRTKLRVL